MKFTTIAADAFKKLQLNAGVLLTEFDPANPPKTAEEIAEMRTKIVLSTSGGNTFTAAPTYVDFGEDIDNVPANTKELKILDSVEATMSGTGKTVDTAVAKMLIGAADVDAATGKITPRADLMDGDFADLWWVGDYSDVNTGDDAGFIAIRLINALSTGGFSLAPNDKGKGDFAYTFTGHYSLTDISVLPYEIYIVEGSEPPAPTYTYTPVTPVGTEDPSEEGWYERSGTEGSYTYALTTDTTVDSEKTYYERS
jgi:hypothetical protein